MLDDKNWVVDIRLSYNVRAQSPDAALGAVLPLISLGRDRYGPQPDVADYTVHERLEIQNESPATRSDPGLTKSVYTAKEVAELLNISTASVYEKIPAYRYCYLGCVPILGHIVENRVRARSGLD